MNCKLAANTTLVLVALFTSSASAQVCPPGWVSNIGSGANNSVESLAVFPNGDILAGGTFTLIGGISTPNKLARYSAATQTWSTTPVGGLANIVHALGVLPDGDMLAGGNFSSIGGTPINRIGRYDFGTNTWTDLGYGGNGGSVETMLVHPSGNVIIGGNIPRIAGVVAEHIGRYSLTTGTWTQMFSNFSSSGDRVYALALAPDGTVVMGGVYLARGSGVPRLQRYNLTTNTWTSLGNGVNNTVNAVAVLPDGDIIAGGVFTSADGLPVSRIARLNPTTGVWSDMGGGTSGGFNYIKSITLLNNGDIVVGGSFTVISGVVASGIARYTPSTNTWSALSSGVNSDVEAIVAHPNGDIIAGGYFTNVGARIARYSFGGTAATIVEDPQSIGQACEGEDASFSVLATGSPTLMYQWRKDGAPISYVLNPSAITSTLTITNPLAGDIGSYDCVVSNTCGSVISNAALIDSIGDCSYCPADFNQDGGIDGTDVDAFFAAWVEADSSADTNLDGGVDGADVDAFFVAWVNGGC